MHDLMERGRLGSAACVRKRIAIAVLVPRGGAGSATAGPLAMRILGALRELGYLE
jgi:hypothetical protein